MIKFETGKTYSTRSICDHSWVITAHIVRRTVKTVWLSTDDRTDHLARGKCLRVKEYKGVEQIKPFGRYSMSPMIGADD